VNPCVLLTTAVHERRDDNVTGENAFSNVTAWRFGSTTGYGRRME
jgi:hypothetical protein